MQEQAEQYVWDVIHQNRINTEFVSDSGTVENLLSDGLTLSQIVGGMVPDQRVLDNICWLDD